MTSLLFTTYSEASELEAAAAAANDVTTTILAQRMELDSKTKTVGMLEESAESAERADSVPCQGDGERRAKETAAAEDRIRGYYSETPVLHRSGECCVCMSTLYQMSSELFLADRRQESAE